MTLNITNIVKVGSYNGFVGSEAPSVVLKNGDFSVKFSILSSGKRFNITRFKKGKACGWMSMIPTELASSKLNDFIANGYELA